MSSLYLKLNNFLNNGKNFYKIFFFLVVFLCVVKLPSLLTSDIQPWDEGMYASRVLSIHENGDFVDQSSHSVGKFYSASHPPLLIWTGYFVTLITGINSIALKLTVFVFSLLCVLLILLIGKNLYSLSTGFYASLIFCSNIIFTVFSQRFQFDIPYTFFILLSFYLIFLYNDSLKLKYLILSGISFGFCLMTKILVGFYIPMILFISFFFIRDKVSYKLKDIIILTAIGIAAALPWHLYMLLEFGSEFTDYFFKFHIYDRAFQGVELNQKSSGAFYHINYLLSIIPYGILAFIGLFSDLKNFRNRDWRELFFGIWFITGLIILALFKTKLEAYVLMILLPASFLIPLYIKRSDYENLITKIFVILFLLLNIIWFSTETIRPGIKDFVIENKTVSLTGSAIALILLFFLSRYSAYRIELKKTLYIFILVFFLVINLYYLFFIPEWVNRYRMSAIKEQIETGNKRAIIYIGTNYRYNPQFSFYFRGLNLNWENPAYEFELLDVKDKSGEVKEYLESLPDSSYYFIVEKDHINRAEYPSSVFFIPEDSKLIKKENGYELYEN